MTSTNDGFASKGERGVNGASSHPAPRPPLHAPVPTYNATATFIRGRSTSPAAAELTASPLEHPLPGASTSPALDASLPGVGTPPTSRPRTPLASSSSAPSSGAVPSSPFTLSRQGSPRHLLDSDGPIKRGDDGKALRPIRLYYSNEFKHVAEDVAQLSDGRVELCEIDWKRFPDGWPNLRIDKSAEMKWFHVAFLASLHSPETFFEQYAVCSYLPKLLPKSFKLFVPFFSTGTMERVSRPGEIATANTLARLLSTVPSCAKGPAQISVFDIHTLQSQFYFKDSVLIRLTSAIPLLLDRLRRLPGRVNVAFPDEGAYKRFNDQFEPLYPNPVVCQKIRDGPRRIVQIKEGDVRGLHVVIVDDLAQSGGTLLECAQQLRKNGATAVSAYVTHVVFPCEAERKFVAKPGEAAVLETFWCTDTNPVVADRVRKIGAPFEVLSIAPMLLDILLDDTV